MKARTTKIADEQAYNTAMERVDTLMKKGEGNLSAKEEAELSSLALAAEEYEEKHIYKPAPPKTLEGLIELYMYKRRLNQGQMAKTLGISQAKFSLILSGKQKPDVKFLKAVHKKLDIDANQLLEVV